jgi:FdhD protein
VSAAVRLAPADIDAGLRAVSRAQVLGTATRATHAAGAWTRGRGLIALREDVGRHNALDKLVGALARAGEPAPDLVVITSRVSVEMVQKAAVLGVPVLAAVSAPTSLAVATAKAAGITLIAVARDDGFEIFTHPGRIAAEAGSSRDVA